MSHFTTIQTQIRDLEALRAACQELGLPLLEAGLARGYAGSTIQGARVIKLDGPYDIAVNPAEGGGYQLASDLWEGHVEREVGRGYARLLQLYGVHKATREAKRKGCLVQRKNQPDGSIKLVIAGGL